MNIAIIGGFFGAFLYFKVAFEAGFENGINIIGAFLISLMYGAFLLAASDGSPARLMQYKWRSSTTPETASEIVRKTILQFLLKYIAFGCLCAIVIFGFSTPLNNEIRFLVFFDEYYSAYWIPLRKEIAIYWAIIFFPMFTQYVIYIYRFYLNSKNR